jgi:hypothetical protein
MAQIAPPGAPPLRAAVSQQLAAYNQQHAGRPIDPRAALAVAAQEGLSGGIGDGGHAFGPFQLNNAGGVLTGRFPGQSPAQLQAWASSPAGIQDALGRIGGVAGGLKGAQAVKAIVSQFERPANIPREIQSALAAYGIQPQVAARSLAGAAASSLSAAPALQVAPLPDFRAELAQALAGARSSSTNDLSGFYSTLHQALQARAAAQQPSALPVSAPRAPQLAGNRQASTIPAGPVGHGRVVGNTTGEQPNFLAALAGLAAYEHAPVSINSGYRSTAKQAQLYANRASNPNPVAPPGHSLHEQGLAADGTVGGKPLGTLPAAVLKRFGLMPVPGDPVHVQILR